MRDDEIGDLASETEDRGTEKSPAYTNVADFVEDYLKAITQIPLSKQSGHAPVWDPRWWRHTAVVVRLEALWRSWEGARASKDPMAMSAWFIHHYDPTMRALMAENGPMSGAPDPAWGGHPPLPVEKAPSFLRQPAKMQ